MAIPPTLTVRDVMTKDFISVKTTDKVLMAIEVMTQNDIGSVVVTEDGKPLGIVTVSYTTKGHFVHVKAALIVSNIRRNQQ